MSIRSLFPLCALYGNRTIDYELIKDSGLIHNIREWGFAKTSEAENIDLTDTEIDSEVLELLAELSSGVKRNPLDISNLTLTKLIKVLIPRMGEPISSRLLTTS